MPENRDVPNESTELDEATTQPADVDKAVPEGVESAAGVSTDVVDKELRRDTGEPGQPILTTREPGANLTGSTQRS